MVRSLAVIFFIFSISIGISQDIHFSQFFKTPLNTNPALTGVMAGDCRGVVNYRNQWSAVTTPFITASGSYEVKKFVKENFFSYGLLFFHDRSGTQSFRTNSGYLSLAFQKKIGGAFLSIGAQGGLVNKSVRTNLAFDQNYDNTIGGFNLDLNSGEVGNLNVPDPIYYPDLNAGLMWFNNSGEKVQYWFGASMFHVLSPEESFLDNNNAWTLPIKYGGNFGFRYNLGQVYIEPRGLFMQQSVFREILLGGNIGLDLDETGLFVGAYVRRTSNSSDALIPMAGLKIKNIEFNLSYDVNISTLVNASGSLGGYELSFIYNCASSKIYNVVVPCRRY